MKAEQLRQMSTEELTHELSDLQKRLFEMRSQSVTENPEDTKARKNVKRDIARIKTILNEKE